MGGLYWHIASHSIAQLPHTKNKNKWKAKQTKTKHRHCAKGGAQRRAVYLWQVLPFSCYLCHPPSISTAETIRHVPHTKSANRSSVLRFTLPPSQPPGLPPRMPASMTLYPLPSPPHIQLYIVSLKPKKKKINNNNNNNTKNLNPLPFGHWQWHYQCVIVVSLSLYE